MLETVRVEDLRALPAMASATLLGGAAALGSVVADVKLVEAGQVMTCELVPECAVVFALAAGAGAVHRQHLLDLLLRRAHTARAAAVIVVGMTGTVPVATRRLADRLRLPTLVAADDLTPLGSPSTCASRCLHHRQSRGACWSAWPAHWRQRPICPRSHGRGNRTRRRLGVSLYGAGRRLRGTVADG